MFVICQKIKITFYSMDIVENRSYKTKVLWDFSPSTFIYIIRNCEYRLNALALNFFMHTGVQRKYVIKPINRFADGRPAHE